MHQAAIDAFYYYCDCSWAGMYGSAQKYLRQIRALGYSVLYEKEYTALLPFNSKVVIVDVYGSMYADNMK